MSKDSAALQIPSIMKTMRRIDVLDSRGGSTFQDRRTREIAQEKQDPVKRATASRPACRWMWWKLSGLFEGMSVTARKIFGGNESERWKSSPTLPTGNWQLAKFSYRCAANPSKAEPAAVIARPSDSRRASRAGGLPG